MRCRLIFTVFLVILGCNPFDSTKDVSDGVPIRDRCIRLVKPMYLITTPGPAGTSAYLDEALAVGDGSKSVAVREGTTLEVKRIALVRSFEDTQLAFVGAINGYEGDVWVNTVFTIDWRNRTADVAMRGFRQPITVESALKTDVAKWCN
jgi:hypothetical protein